MQFSAVFLAVLLTVALVKGAESKPYSDQNASPSLSLRKRDIPKEETKCDCRVEPMFSPVCGSDHKTYSNKHKLECEVTCGRAPDLKMVHEGRCETDTSEKE